ncbi:MAG: 3-hydroxybutyryl-CoA dehydrogenase [Planctomycetota bacterium]|nr:3-hydroxybutyryl-CoA dehydrogenase [Planctomycetota bacterium]MDG2143091.1 3-hydroxybutyryl-CoA dehydrogenase [Planctomycetota bacterium]
MTSPIFDEVSVIGAGTMGNGIAQTFAASGYRVNLIDVNADALERGLATIAKSLGRFVKKEKMTQDQVDEILARITGSTEIASAKDSKLVVEAVVERLDVKSSIFAELDTLCAPDAILATNTSSISITAIAAATKRPDKVIGMHFMNPVPLMKLVEIINAHETSQETLDTILRCSETLGKTPVDAADYPGFVSNRVLMPMINEAVYCLMEGVATAEGIDTVMKLGMAHPMGPLQLADLIGLDVCLDIMTVLHEGFGDSKYRPCPLLRRMVFAGNLGRKSGKGFYDYN